MLECVFKQTVVTLKSFLHILHQIWFNMALTWFDLHDHWFAVLISHLLNVQQFMGIAIMPGPTVHKNPGATAATVHHQAVV